MTQPTKAGGLIPVTVENGIPNCPHCGLPTVEIEPGLWQCPFAPLVVLDERSAG